MSPPNIMPDEMSIKSICLDCKNYDRKKGTCTGKNPFAEGKPYLIIAEKVSCFGFEQSSK